MRRVKQYLTKPQAEFVFSKAPFPAMIAGYGCLSKKTKVWTERGLMRICDITSPIRVLSWNKKDHKFQLSLSGGAFPKGRDWLYQVSTQRGVFESTGHHLIFSSYGNYQPVSNLCVGDALVTCSRIRLGTILESALKSSVLDDPHCSQTNADLMGSYANEARQYGQQFLGHSSTGQVSFSLQGDVQELGQTSLSEDKILQISCQEHSVYYDMQVLETNNYIDEFGFIHHNSGKTTAGVTRAFDLKCKYPRQKVGYYLPTYPLINDIVVPRFEEFLSDKGIRYTYNKKDKELKIDRLGSIILRTMDNPERIVGYEHADAICDELDTLNIEKATNVWRKITARNREKKPDGSQNTLASVTTPEGFKFMYENWQKDPKPGFEMIRASTYSNQRNLPANYINDLISQYPAQLIQAYIHGEFVNLANKSVYSEFDRIKCACNAEIQPREILRIGMDFNVGHMSAVVHVMRMDEDGVQKAYAVDELQGLLDTPEMIANIKLLYPDYQIIVYPDASGDARKSNNASATDIALLREAGFKVFVNTKNPFVKDRVLAFNVLLKSGRYLVNIDKCPLLVESLEKQAYNDRGEPDKGSGLDHSNDAAGYFVNYEFGIARGKTAQFNLKGI